MLAPGTVEWASVLILLPPSEGKTAPARGRPFDPSSLTRPDLTEPRERVRAALAEVSAHPHALRTLGVGATLREEVERNLDLSRAPAAPAAEVYTGVLYEAAQLAHLNGTARRRANTSVRVISALWGALSPADRIPAYRVSMDTTLPGVGKLARFWREHLGTHLLAASGHAADRPCAATDHAATSESPTADSRHDVVIDCRSAAYQAAWHPPTGTPWLTVRVVQERQDGTRAVVSHHAKHTRGLLTHHLLTRAGAPPRTIAATVAAAGELIGPVLREVNHRPAAQAHRGADQLELVLA